MKWRSFHELSDSGFYWHALRDSDLRIVEFRRSDKWTQARYYDIGDWQANTVDQTHVRESFFYGPLTPPDRGGN